MKTFGTILLLCLCWPVVFFTAGERFTLGQ
jgi:hypothetical protein